MKKQNSYLSIIVPIFNEEEVIANFFDVMNKVLQECQEQKLLSDWEIICVDDGSQDKSYDMLCEISNKDERVKILSFSRNFGKEIALSAGLEHASGDIVIPIDADLQDPPSLIPEMIEKWREGFDVVLATRKNRQGETYLKKATASAFYKIIGKISHINIPANTGDFRLLDRKVVNAIKQLPERSRFMKGILAWPGFKTTSVYFDRDPRHAGKTSWNMWKLWQFALDGIFGFTSAPLKIWTYVGIIISLVSFIYAGTLIAKTIIYGVDVPGYASLITVVLFIGGIQLISLGIQGEYISRIYKEVKHRPLYIINEKKGFKD